MALETKPVPNKTTKINLENFYLLREKPQLECTKKILIDNEVNKAIKRR